MTIHAAPDFSRRYWDAENTAVADRLLLEAGTWIRSPIRTFQVHRWCYSQPVEPVTEPGPFLRDPAPLIFAGDAFGGGRVEGAALSGLFAAEWLLASA